MSSVQLIKDYRNKKGNMKFYSVPLENGNYTTIQNSVWENTNLSDKAVRVFGLILKHRFNTSYQINAYILSEILNCDEKTIKRCFKELKDEGYLKIYKNGEMRGNKPVYEYEIFESPLSLEERQIGDKGRGQRQGTKAGDKNVPLSNKVNKKINKVSTKEKKESFKISEKEKITHSLSEKTKKEIKTISEDENVESSIIEFSNKAEEEKIKTELENLANTLEINTQLKEFRYLILNTKKIRNTKPFDLIIEQIKTLPEYLNASSKKFPEQKYTKSQNLNYLSTILENPKGDYPKWFNDIEKNKVIETKKDEWKEFIKIWDKFSVASTQKDSLNLIISHFMIFIMESTKSGSKYYNGLKNYTEDSLRKSLKIKSIDEIMLMIDSQINEQNGASTTFKKDTKDFFLNGFTIDSIKDLFKSIEV